MACGGGWYTAEAVKNSIWEGGERSGIAPKPSGMSPGGGGNGMESRRYRRVFGTAC